MKEISPISKMRGRMRIILAAMLVLGFVVLVAQLFVLQIVRGEELQSKAARQQTRSTTLGANRGTIYDRNRNALARSATVWNVCISPADINEETLDATATKLAEILDVEKAKILEAASDSKSFYKIIKKRCDHALMQQVLDYISGDPNDPKDDIRGVFFEEGTKRYYTYGSLASTVLGFTNYDNQGAYGIEAYYNKVLSGTPGMVVSAKNARGADMPFKYSQRNEAEDGNSIVLTIDESIQHIVERHLETAVVEHSIQNRAVGIVMNVKTGEIIAMSSKHDFDPNAPDTLQSRAAAETLDQFGRAFPPETQEYQKKLQNLRYDQWRNKAISDPYEPGSVFKIITASTALDNKVVSLNDSFYCDGSVKVANHTYGCWQQRGHGQQDFIKGMQNSCNPVFIAVGQRIGANLFYDYLGNFGFSETSGIDLPGDVPGILQSYDILSKPGMVELSSVSFGQTFKVTPLQMITATSAAVNGGYLMKPYIVKQILDENGNVIETTQPVVRRQVISEETSATVRMLVEAVVDGGSGRTAAIPGYRIGGKTGTSEKKDILDRDEFVLSFIGFAPMEDPEYAVLVVLDEPVPKANMYGSTIAAPVVGAILSEMLPYVGLEPQYTQEQLEQKEVEVAELVGMKPHDAQSVLTAAGLKMRIVGEGPDIIRQMPQAWQKIPRGGTVIVYTDEESIKSGIITPDVAGLPAQQANKILADAGFNVELRGVTNDGVATIVQEQWPLPGVEGKTGDVVVITLTHAPQ